MSQFQQDSNGYLWLVSLPSARFRAGAPDSQNTLPGGIPPPASLAVSGGPLYRQPSGSSTHSFPVPTLPLPVPSPYFHTSLGLILAQVMQAFSLSPDATVGSGMLKLLPVSCLPGNPIQSCRFETSPLFRYYVCMVPGSRGGETPISPLCLTATPFPGN